MKKGKPRVKDWVIGGVIGGAAGFAASYLVKVPYTRWRVKQGIDPNHTVHHSDIGMAIASFGALTGMENPYTPYIVGFGTGMAGEDFAHHYLGYDVKNEVYEPPEDNGQVRVGVARSVPEVVDVDFDDDIPEPERDGSEKVGQPVEDGGLPDPEEEGMHEMEEASPEEIAAPQQIVQYRTLPDYPATVRTAFMVDIIRQIAYEDMHNPHVRKVAEDIIKEGGYHGTDYENIVSAIQLWVQNNVRYVHDELRSSDGRGSDRYQHAYITMPQTKENPAGRGVGDCDDMAILYLALAGSVGIPGICAVLVDQTGRGYGHIMGGWIPGGKKPSGIDDVVTIEMTTPRPFGWRPNAKRFGFVLV